MAEARHAALTKLNILCSFFLPALVGTSLFRGDARFGLDVLHHLSSCFFLRSCVRMQSVISIIRHCVSVFCFC